jgi:hypothetical protein
LKTYWHKTNPSLNASANSRRSLSSPAALSPLDDMAPTCTLLELDETPLLPHIRSKRTKALVRNSTSSQALIPASVWLIWDGGLRTALQSIEDAILMLSRCSGFEGSFKEVDEML